LLTALPLVLLLLVPLPVLLTLLPTGCPALKLPEPVSTAETAPTVGTSEFMKSLADSCQSSCPLEQPPTEHFASAPPAMSITARDIPSRKIKYLLNLFQLRHTSPHSIVPSSGFSIFKLFR
jgi:hypothetical protein